MDGVLEPRIVAALEERRIATGVGDIASETLDWCGGVACFGGLGSWANQALGCCMDGEPATGAGVAEMSSWYESRGCEPKVLVCPFADGSLVRELGEAGFRLREFEMVFACDLRGREVGAWEMPPGVEFEELDSDDESELDTSVRLATSIYAPDGNPSDAMIENFRRMARYPTMRTLIVRADGQMVASSAIEFGPELSSLCGAAVTPTHRKRGIQTALIEARLDMAVRHGCTIVTVSSLPGVATERNAMRLGFLPSYTKVAMVRPGDGLVASP